MAKKLKLMSLFQELQGRAQITNRRPAPPSAGVYLMQLRTQTGTTTLPRRRFMISVDLPPPQPTPHPVKINHVRTAELSASPATGESLRLSPTSKVSANLPQVH